MTRPFVRVLLVSTDLDVGVLSQWMSGTEEQVEVDGATSIEDAARCMSTIRYDCVILDLSLMGVDQVHPLQTLNAVDPTAAIVVLSPADRDAETIEALEMGAEGHLTSGHLDPVLVRREVRFAVVRKRAETDRVRRALHDPLTGLQNRLAVEEFLPVALHRAERRGTRVGVVFVDVEVADQVHRDHGRQAWDAVMHEVASRLRVVARESDTVARMTGGTFVVVCEDLTLEAHVRGLADRVHEIFAEPMLLEDGTAVGLVVSLGLTGGDGWTQPSDLLRQTAAKPVEPA